MAVRTHLLDERPAFAGWQIGQESSRGSQTRNGCRRPIANRAATGWCRDHVVPHALVVQLYGRLRYQGGDRSTGINMSSAPFASILVIWPREAGDIILRHCTPVSAALLQLPH
jgi:hypothetical protein